MCTPKVLLWHLYFWQFPAFRIVNSAILIFLCDDSMKGGGESYLASCLPSLFLKLPLVPSSVKSTNNLSAVTSAFNKSPEIYFLIPSLYHLVYIIGILLIARNMFTVSLQTRK